MKKYLLVVTVLFLAITAVGQAKKDEKKLADEDAKALVIAKKAFEAHGGEKFKNMNTLSVIGSVDVTVSAYNQAFPASFATIFSGEKYRLEINSAFANFKQIYNGTETFTSPQQGFSLPPINQLGLPLLQRLGDDGFVVTALEKKKKLGFRITSPEGYYTDFFLKKKTNRVKGYESSYIVNGNTATTSVEMDKFVDKNGIIIPSKYAQRFDFGQMTVYAEFKAKEILVNTEIEDDIFAL